MQRRRLALALAFSMSGALEARAWPELDLHGLIDGRYVHTGDVRATEDGGYGALRYGANSKGDARDLLRLSDASLIADLKLDWGLDLITHVRAIPEQRTALDVVESFLRWRPVSTSNWRFAAKAGYFIPDFSLENQSIGWTSPYTLTASAINSWIGEEIRVAAAEGSLEWRDGDQRIKASAGVFYGNDPAGVVIDRYGFILSDRLTGLMDRVRLPNGSAGQEQFAHPITEIDGRPGAYVTGEWAPGEDVKLVGGYYDNNADRSAISGGVRAWRTKFGEVGIEALLPGEVEVLAQALAGNTQLAPFGRLTEDLDFTGAYLLASRQFGEHRFTLRGDLFHNTAPLRSDRYQRGNALTFAWIYYPFDKARLTVETIYVNSFQPNLLDLNQSGRLHEVQLQMSWRYYF